MLSSLGHCSPSWLPGCLSAQPCLDTPAVPCSFLPSLAGEVAVFWDLITGSPRAFQPITGLLPAAAGRTAERGEEQRLPGMAAVPSGQPTLLGLHFPEQNMSRSHFARSDNKRGNTCSRRDEKARGPCSQGGGQEAVPRGSACSWAPGSALQLLDND